MVLRFKWYITYLNYDFQIYHDSNIFKAVNLPQNYQGDIFKIIYKRLSKINDIRGIR